ncbi:MAG: soluble lytic murein transglycosylase [Candidatus Azotimanducaceae bacterium]|jgi:soluble lytic murein transglycosylase
MARIFSKRLLLFTTLASLLFVESSLVFSAAAKPNDFVTKFEQRKAYKNAIRSVKLGQRSKFQQQKKALTNYALYPYLEYYERIYQISRQDNAGIDAFLSQYADTPLTLRLRQNWLYHLAKRGQWDDFINYYDQPTANKINACNYGYALHRTGQVDAAYEQAERLWSVNYSQPDECDSIFKVWRGAKGLTPDLAWTRFALSMRAGKITLASYLLRFLDKQDASYGATFLGVHRKPELIKNTTKYSLSNQRESEIVLHGLKRLARRDAQAAFDAMQRFGPDLVADETESKALLLHIGYRLASQGDALNSLDSYPIKVSTDPKLIESRLRLALKRGDTSDVLILMHQLPDRIRNVPRWRYWHARILEDSTQQAEQDDAKQTLAELANTRSYYGFLAADHLDLPYQFQNITAGITEEEILALEASPAMERALELYAIGELTLARREWLNNVNQFSNRERQIAGYVAQRWGWHKRAIQAMIDAEAWNDLDIRFPLAYQDSFIANAVKADIPVTFGFAIARQESAFMPDAKSGAGALGLMQMIPSTAKMTARRHNLRPPSSNTLIDPETNIQLGTSHLGTLLRRFNNNRILASVAYNAGPRRVQQWLDPALPVDVWIETIPFTETRNYVQNVLMFAAIYGNRLQNTQPLIMEHERAAFPATLMTLSSTSQQIIDSEKSD